MAYCVPGVSLLPKSKKARALLALIALSEEKTVSRARAASMLWSNLERRAALTRLRNTLHHLQQGFSEAGLEPFRVDDQAIAFRANTVWLDVEHGAITDVATVGAEHRFLIELEGTDSAFDHWLTRIRDEMFINRVPAEQVEITATSPAPHRRITGRPRIAVTEIEGVGLGVEERFARVVTEEVGNALARSRWFETITRSTRGQRLTAGNDDVANIADYLLVGTLQCNLDRYRLLLELLDLHNSARVVWVESFERPATELTAQRKLADVVAARLDTDLLLIEAERRRHLPLQKNDAYTLVLLAIPAIYRLDKDPFLGAGHALEEAIASDRDSALAHSWLAYWHMFLIGQGWASNPGQSMMLASKAAERAMMLDPRDARAITIAGHCKAFLGRHLEEAATLHELSIQTNPALSLAWHLYGVTHAYAGRLEDALRSVSHSLELAPSDPHGFFAEGALGIVHLLRGEHKAAVAIGRRVTERHPHFSSAHKSYLAALGHLGRKAEAAAVLQRLRILEPRFSLQRFRATAQYRRAQDLECFMIGFRLAGLT